MYRPHFLHVDAECILLGMLANGQLLMVPRSLINEHVYIAGHTGSGKTVLGFIGMLDQLAREWKRARRHIDGMLWRLAPDNERLVWQRQPRPVICILDLKGDPALYNSARIMAKRSGYPFKFFSIDERYPGQIFDVFQSLQPCSTSALAELLLMALGIEHGEGYGKSHYTRANLTRMSEVLIKKGNPTIRSWKHLLDLVRDRECWADMPSATDASELINAIHGMMVLDRSIEKLAANGRKPDNVGVIHAPTALRERQMLYFWLPSGIGSMSARNVGKLALYALTTAAKQLSDEGIHKIQTYIFIDEFHMLLGRNIELILTQARSSRISLILANQYSGRLAEEDLNLRRMVLESTRIKQFFTVTDPLDIEEMTRVAGQKIVLMNSGGHSNSVSCDSRGGSSSTSGSHESWSEQFAPRFDIDLAPVVTEDPVGSLVWIQRGEGLARFRGIPQYLQSFWPMKPYQYALRNGFHHMPWPTPEDNLPPEPQFELKPETQRAIKPRDKALIKKIQERLDQGPLPSQVAQEEVATTTVITWLENE